MSAATKRQHQWSVQNVSGEPSGQTLVPRLEIALSCSPSPSTPPRSLARSSPPPAFQSRKTSTPTRTFFSRGRDAAALRELQTELSVATQELAAAHAATLQLRREALPAAGEAAALLLRAHAAGQATQFEVLESERSRNDLRRELLDQETAFATALVRAEALADPAFPLTRQLLATP